MQELLSECRAQDEVLRGAGLEIWLGAEPTFTDRTSQDPHWLWKARLSSFAPQRQPIHLFVGRFLCQIRFCLGFGLRFIL